MRTRSLTCAVLCLAGCAALPAAPPYSHESLDGVVYAHSAQEAQEFGRLASRLARNVRTRLRLQPPTTPFEIWILDGEKPGSGMASTVNRYQRDELARRFIQLGTEGHFAREYLLVHELVHWYVEESLHLPLVVEEGLAELVACSLAPLGGEQLRVHLQTLTQAVREDRGAPWAVELDRQGWLRLEEEERTLAYALGYIVAAELRVDTVSAMADRPAYDFFARARIDPLVPATWQPHVDQLARRVSALGAGAPRRRSPDRR